MLGNTTKYFLQLGLLAMGVSLWASCGSDDGGETESAAGCTPGETQACTCEDGNSGSQTCNSAGNAFSICECTPDPIPDTCGDGAVDDGEECDDGNNDNNDGCSASCRNEFCGDGVKQDDEDCDDGNNSEFDMCPNDCIIPGGTGGGGTGGGPPSCQDVIVYAGMTTPQKSKWESLGKTGLEAGQDLCADASFGSHVCTYEELLIAEAKGELSSIPDGESWLHRTTPVMVNGNMTEANAGARCNDWEYETDHFADGEYVSFSGGVATYHFDPTPQLSPPVLDGNGNPIPGQFETIYATPGLGCGGGGLRSVLCCNPCQQ